jgi:uncharacterized protein (DUF488 family)
MPHQNPVTLYTIGHSNRHIDEFVALLRLIPINTLVDVRAYPQSQRYPQFSQEPLRQSLEAAGVVYHWAGKPLGGMRKYHGASQHSALEDESLKAYAVHMESQGFQKAAVQLIHLATINNTAILCAEKLPQHCHRGLLSDYMLLQAVDVRHIIDHENIVGHFLSPLARRESRELVYDRGVTQLLDL